MKYLLSMSLCAVSLPLYGADGQAIRVSYDGSKSAVVTWDGDLWRLQAEGQRLSLTRAADGAITLRKNDAVVATSKPSGGELVLQGAETRVLKFEFKADKIQVWSSPDGDPVEFKAKDGEFKVRQGKTELGKIKFYPDTGKIKAKNVADEEVAVCRGRTQAKAACGAFLLPADTPADQKLLAFLVLVALDR